MSDKKLKNEYGIAWHYSNHERKNKLAFIADDKDKAEAMIQHIITNQPPKWFSFRDQDLAIYHLNTANITYISLFALKNIESRKLDIAEQIKERILSEME